MEAKTKNFLYPPGGILLWLIIFLELITFGAAIIIMVVYGKEEPLVYHQSRLQLNILLGTINTCILLSSGYFMAEAVRKQKLGETKSAATFLKLTILFGFLFVFVKSFEYYQKLNEGLGFSTNIFFSFYWSLTIFHLAHVLTGITILLFFAGKFAGNKNIGMTDFESAATFWHLCDLIWLLIFPTLYLLF